VGFVKKFGGLCKEVWWATKTRLVGNNVWWVTKTRLVGNKKTLGGYELWFYPFL